MLLNDTIIALATPQGAGAIAILRISGKDAIPLTASLFESIKGKNLIDQASHTLVLGHIIDEGRTIDQVLVSIFKNPYSYTGEDVIEVSCHGSPYIQQEILQLFVKNGCRLADPGEFTLRAFLNGKLDLSQAEAVADLIASDSKASHQLAIAQMRGGFSSEIEELRQELLNFASLIELELDFSEEDVDFADRAAFQTLIDTISRVLKRLIESFAFGNVLKNGIPVAIIGEPNVGKSTLLNSLLNEDKAIVSDIAGTTRDTIEDEIVLNGVSYRFIDTAGIRETQDLIENIGIKKTYEASAKAQLILFLFDVSQSYAAPTKLHESQLQHVQAEIKKIQTQFPDKKIRVVANKSDLVPTNQLDQLKKELPDALFISAKDQSGIELLKKELTNLINTGALSNNQSIVSNSRHFEALNLALESINAVQYGIDQEISSDLIAIDIRAALAHLGAITGKVTNEDLLGNIFANFCIGK